MKELFSLEGKVAVVTGASKGLGRAMAIGLAKAGAKVVATHTSGETDTVDEIKKIEKDAIWARVDVTNKDEIKEMVKKAKDKFGRIDILVNNAGVFKMSPAEMITEEEWDNVIDVNLKGQFLCAQEVAKEMINQKSGKIINIASIAGKLAFSHSTAYNASKAGVILLTKTLATELGQYNIQVNSICPGLFATKMTEDLVNDDNIIKMVKERVPLGRHGQPEELMGSVIYLASKASDYTTGHALVVDGGWTSRL
jgi:NAD(P)-dependent dehydrogenase (short-subunit alcohol dehydrogenase family)